MEAGSALAEPTAGSVPFSHRQGAFPWGLTWVSWEWAYGSDFFPWVTQRGLCPLPRVFVPLAWGARPLSLGIRVPGLPAAPVSHLVPAARRGVPSGSRAWPSSLWGSLLADPPISALPTACCRQSPPRSLTPGMSGPGTASPSPTCAAASEGPWHGLPPPPSTRQPR